MPTLRVAMPIAERSRLSESWLARRVYLSAAGVAAAGALAAGAPAAACAPHGEEAAAVVAVSIRAVAMAFDRIVSQRSSPGRRSYRAPGPIRPRTRGACGLAGFGSSLSYQRLARELLGVELPKNETRTNWLARPLSPAQRAYAAEDVAWLLPLHHRLRGELAAQDRLGWALEDSAALLDTGRFAPDPEAAYLRIKGASGLGRRQLAVLRELAAWRDREARRRDLPPGFLGRHEPLLALAPP